MASMAHARIRPGTTAPFNRAFQASQHFLALESMPDTPEFIPGTMPNQKQRQADSLRTSRAMSVDPFAEELVVYSTRFAQ